MKLKKGDKIRITGAFRRAATVIEGTVISWSDFGDDNGPNWYIELRPTNIKGSNYLYWKQGIDGGTVEKI
jgi:hypothetical protein